MSTPSMTTRTDFRSGRSARATTGVQPPISVSTGRVLHPRAARVGGGGADGLASTAVAGSRFHVLRRAALLLVPVLVGLAGAWAGLAVLSRHSVAMGPFTVQLSTSYGRGVTGIDLPPLGRLTADTHRAPLRFKATLESVNVPRLTQVLRDRGTDGLVEQVQ